jgi:hypothetical protein
MNRTALAASFAFCLAASALAAGTREDRPVSGFHALSMGAVVDVDVIQDGKESLTLEGDPETLARIDTAVRDGTLEITYKRESRNYNTHGRVHAVVHARDMDAIALSGAGNVRSDALEGDSMTLSISGSGDMDIGRITAKRASLSISGSGNMKVAGAAEDLKARISGSGDIKAAKLETQRAEIAIAGAGNATLWAKQRLATSISGVGNVRYYGDPEIRKSVHGVGHVERVAANP